MNSEEVRKREITPLRKIPIKYEKIGLSRDKALNNVYNGMKSINLIDWFLS